MSVNETITLDPSQFSVGRTEVGLDAPGISVREVDWGDADMELFYVRQALGEIPADRHPPNRAVSITLDVKKEGAMSLPAAALRLQQKVGLLQAEGGWVRRDLKDAGIPGSFAVPVAYRVYSATLSGLDGWHMMHRDRAPEVSLTLAVSPYCYGTSEEILTDHVETTAAELTFTEAFKGSAPGLLRLTIDNDSVADWSSVVVANEQRDYSAASTAALSYEAEALTPLNGASIATRTGASSGASNNVIKSSVLTTNWLPILSSVILSGTANMTHVGGRRMMFRVYDPSAASGRVQLRLDWRPVGSPTWTQNVNDVWTSSVFGGFSKIDLGEARPPRAVLGSSAWEWRLMARLTPSAPTGGTVEVDKVWPLPTEQFARALIVPPAANLLLPSAGTLTGHDEFDQTAGNLNAKVAPQGGTWATAGATTDFAVEVTGHTLQRATVGPEALRSATLGTTPSFTDMGCSVDFKLSSLGVTGSILMVALVASGVGGSVLIGASGAGQLAGNGPVRLYQPGTFLANTWYTLTLVVFGSYCYAWVDLQGSQGGSTPVSGVVAPPAAAAPQLQEQMQSGSGVTRNYDNFRVWQIDRGAVAKAGRSMEFRSDGVFGQHATLDVWPRLNDDGFLLQASPAGVESRTSRWCVIPSRGDLVSMQDSGIDDVSARIRYYPGYHFASEVA